MSARATAALTFKAETSDGIVTVWAYGPDPFGGVGPVNLGAVLQVPADAQNLMRLALNTREILDVLHDEITPGAVRRFPAFDAKGRRVLVTIPESGR